MILSSGKVVGSVDGNSKEQWKEVKDNRVKAIANQTEVQGKTGKEIVPVQQGEKQQGNGGNNGKNSGKQNEIQSKIGKEIVPVDQGANNQVQVGNKFAVLEVMDDEEENGNQLMLVDDQPSPRNPVTRDQITAQQRQKSNANNARKLNPAAPVFNPNSVGIGSTNGCVDTTPTGKGKETNRAKESTAQWVQRTFKDNAVGINTSCQDIPSQDTLVDRELAKTTDNQSSGAKTRSDFPKVNERVQWSGGRLWSDQIEEDSDEGEVPDGVPADDEPIDDDQEGEEQSVNGDPIVTGKNTSEENPNNVNMESNEQEAGKDRQVATRSDGIGTENSEGRGTDAVDPEGTREIAVQNVIVDDNQKEIANTGNEQLLNAQPPVQPKNTVPLESTQLKLQKKGEEQAMVPKLQKPNTVDALGVNDANDVDEEVDRTCKDLDQESTAQNFLNVARQGDLSPRHIEKAKSAAKGRKK
ncbi:uncharacterized protein [Nicotiana tomentosiformis]|uniref:uncharacterized protein n=1 Tax=Nicotiana tomentosiformis TaxID=4098 RepID=UPI00388C405F